MHQRQQTSRRKYLYFCTSKASKLSTNTDFNALQPKAPYICLYVCIYIYTYVFKYIYIYVFKYIFICALYMRARLYCMQYICALHYTAIYCTFAVCVRRVRRLKLCALHSILQYSATRICSILQYMRVCSICALSYARCICYATRIA